MLNKVIIRVLIMLIKLYLKLYLCVHKPVLHIFMPFNGRFIDDGDDEYELYDFSCSYVARI